MALNDAHRPNLWDYRNLSIGPAKHCLLEGINKSTTIVTF